MAQLPPRSTEFFSKHVGHEFEHFTRAVGAFVEGRSEPWIHDSALVRGRTLIGFLHHKTGSQGEVVAADFYREGARPNHTPNGTGRWFQFLSGRLMHIGTNRESPGFDVWPCATPTHPKPDDRLYKLADLIHALARSRLDALRPDCNRALEMMVVASDCYLRASSTVDPAMMSPAHIALELGAELGVQYRLYD